MKKRVFLVLSFVFTTSQVVGQVTYERLLKADKEPANWLTYSGTYASHRYTSLDQITR